MQFKILKFFSINKKTLVIRNLISVFIFALLYYTIDLIISYYPEFAEKYLLQKKPPDSDQRTKPLYTLKPLLYYFWFSLITQTTVGYTGAISLDNKQTNFIHMRSIPFKIINIIQLLSIFLIPIFI